MQWKEMRPGSWRYQSGPDDGWVEYTLSFGAKDDGVPYETTCFHLHNYSNGAHPDDPQSEFKDENVDYLHICNLSDFKKTIERFEAKVLAKVL